MPLLLKPVPPVQGMRWTRDGIRLFGRSPLAFSLMFVSFLFVALLSSFVPVVGGLFMLAAVPLLSLGFMVASESALAGGPIHPGLYLKPLRTDPGRRRSLLVLCGLYAAATLVIMLVSDAIDGGAFEQLQRLLGDAKRQKEVDALLADPRLAWGVFTRFGLIALLSVPFWHAPALVHWGGQGPAQSLFSSALAVWRSKGAFALYLLSWAALIGVFGLVTALLSSLFNAREVAGMLVLPAGLIFSTAFYVSLLFSFNDTFGGSQAVVGNP